MSRPHTRFNSVRAVLATALYAFSFGLPLFQIAHVCWSLGGHGGRLDSTCRTFLMLGSMDDTSFHDEILPPESWRPSIHLSVSAPRSPFNASGDCDRNRGSPCSLQVARRTCPWSFVPLSDALPALLRLGNCGESWRVTFLLLCDCASPLFLCCTGR